MSRAPTGTITVEMLTDGTRAFRLRFRAHGRREREVLHERRDCACCGGGWTDATARRELDNILARVQAGVWQPRTRPVAGTTPAPAAPVTFHEYASQWLDDKTAGVLGPAISDETRNRLLWALRLYLLPHFAKVLVRDIDRDECLRFKSHLLASADELRRVEAAGERLRHRNGRHARPLSPSSMRKVIDTLAQILDDAVEDGHLQTNPARGKRMRIRVPKPSRTFLEQDELAALLDAAGALDRQTVQHPAAPAGTARDVAALAARGKRPAEIAEALGRSRATISYHLRRLGIEPAGAYLGHRALCATLGYAGPRVSEMCDLRIGQLRLHDANGARFHIPDAKTPTGVRTVEISPALVEILIDHLDRLRRAGLPTSPDAYVFPNTRGRRIDRGRAGEIIRAAATAATEQVQQHGLPPLPYVTPHTLRRTYVSIALLASRFDLRFVMAQVGHADSQMTLDVYAQLQQRHERQHGEVFDQLISSARKRLYGTSDAPIGTPNGTRTPETVSDTIPTEWSDQP
jgi:integrase